MVWALLGLGGGVVVFALLVIPVFIQTAWYQRNLPYIQARFNYLRAEHTVRTIFQDARERMDAVTKVKPERYKPDLGAYEDWWK